MQIGVPRLTVTVHGGGPDDKDRTLVLDVSSLTTRVAAQREAEAAYVLAIVRAHRQCSQELSDRASEAWSRDTRAEEKRTIG